MLPKIVFAARVLWHLPISTSSPTTKMHAQSAVCSPQALRSAPIMNIARVDAHLVGGAGPRTLDLLAPVKIGGDAGAADAEEDCWAPEWMVNRSCTPGMGELACEVFLGEDDCALDFDDLWG